MKQTLNALGGMLDYVSSDLTIFCFGSGLIWLSVLTMTCCDGESSVIYDSVTVLVSGFAFVLCMRRSCCCCSLCWC